MSGRNLRMIHTSDWHLGRSLYDRKRHGEQEAFLDWLADTMEKERTDVLLVCGDVFDSSTPGNTAQALYYRFLCRIARSSCRHVVVVAGNHDSPAFLEAPKPLLKALNIHVSGFAAADPRDEVLVLRDDNGEPEMVVGAVPYLRDRDVRTVEAGESTADKCRKLAEGVAAHYRSVCAAAEEERARMIQPVPLVLTGHLFAAGGKVTEGDGVRELYVGALARVGADAFPAEADYVALGHLHAAQAVGGDERSRYCGTPYPLGFGEGGQEKFVLRVEFDGRKSRAEALPVPFFQRLARVEGDRETVDHRLNELRKEGEPAWLEVFYKGDEPASELRERLDELVNGSGLEILRIQNTRAVRLALGATESGETLDDLDPVEVFRRCLTAREVPEEECAALHAAFHEVLAAVQEKEAEA